MIEVSTGKSVAVTTPKPTYKMKGGQQEVYDVPSETAKFVHDFAIPRGHHRGRTREASFMYWLTRATSTPCATAYSTTIASLQRP